MSQTTTAAVVFVNHPNGMPQESDFSYRIVPVDLQNLANDELVVELVHVSVDPYMRARMKANAPKGYFSPFVIGQPISGGAVVKVVQSNNQHFAVGDVVVGSFDWQKVQRIKIGASELNSFVKIDTSIPVPASYYLGALGMPGMTAYNGFLEICQPKEGEVVLVSAASGAVGSLVGQIAKIKGCKVIGISGSEENAQQLKDLGFDAVINYKNFNNDTHKLKEAIQQACLTKHGVDCYFDNVGGFVLDAATLAMNRRGRISLCGSISAYNTDHSELGPRLNFLYITMELKVQGFVVTSFYGKVAEVTKQMAEWILAGKLKVLETRETGIENIPKSIVKLFTGDKVGKMIVDC